MSSKYQRSSEARKRRRIAGAWLSFFSIFGCGSQDYDPQGPTSFSETLKKVRPLIEKQKGSPPKVYFGSDTNDASVCPLDAICMEASYFGIPQLEWLASNRPDLLEKQKINEAQVFFIRTERRILIDALIVEISAGVTLYPCVQDLTISALALGGGGKIDGSGESCHRLGGTAISILAAEPNSLEIDVSGRKGENGSSPIIPPDERRASDGRLDEVSFPITSQKLAVKKCLSRGACDAKGIDATKVLNANLSWVADRDLISIADFRKFIWDNMVKGGIGEKYWPEPGLIELSDSLSCEFEANGENKTSELFVSAQISGKNLENLNGVSASKAWAGGKGGSGGNAGSVGIVSARALPPSFRVRSEGGTGGEPGNLVAQNPGKGVAPPVQLWSVQFTTTFRIFCKGSLTFQSEMRENGDVIEKEHFSREHPGFELIREKKYNFDFALGKPQSYEISKGLYGSPFLTESFRGADGAPFDSQLLNGMRASRGEPGVASETKFEIKESAPDFLKRVSELCPTCRGVKSPDEFAKEHEI